jgi:hypothetical protein
LGIGGADGQPDRRQLLLAGGDPGDGQASIGSALPLLSWPRRSREVIKVGTSPTVACRSICQCRASWTATARPKLPDPSMPTRTIWRVSNTRTSWLEPSSLLAARG